MLDENYSQGNQPEYSRHRKKDQPKYSRKIELLDAVLEKKAKELGDLLVQISGLDPN